MESEAERVLSFKNFLKRVEGLEALSVITYTFPFTKMHLTFGLRLKYPLK